MNLMEIAGRISPPEEYDVHLQNYLKCLDHQLMLLKFTEKLHLVICAKEPPCPPPPSHSLQFTPSVFQSEISDSICILTADTYRNKKTEE